MFWQLTATPLPNEIWLIECRKNLPIIHESMILRHHLSFSWYFVCGFFSISITYMYGVVNCSCICGGWNFSWIVLLLYETRLYPTGLRFERGCTALHSAACNDASSTSTLSSRRRKKQKNKTRGTLGNLYESNWFLPSSSPRVECTNYSLNSWHCLFVPNRLSTLRVSWSAYASGCSDDALV